MILFETDNLRLRRYGDGVVGLFIGPEHRNGESDVSIFVNPDGTVLVRCDEDHILSADERIDRAGSAIRVTRHYDPAEVKGLLS